MSNITLIQLRDWHRKRATIYRRNNWPESANMHDNMADAIDATQEGEG